MELRFDNFVELCLYLRVLGELRFENTVDPRWEFGEWEGFILILLVIWLYKYLDTVFLCRNGFVHVIFVE